MKKIVTTLMIAGLALLFASCQKELDNAATTCPGDVVVLTLNATHEVDTKTTLGAENKPKWTAGDKVTVMYKKTSQDTWTSAESGAASSADSYVTATFSTSLTSPDGSKDAYAIYPANELTQDVADKAKITIASIQHPTGTSYDGGSDILISKPFDPTDSPVTTQFARLGAVLKIKISNATLASEKIVSFSVQGANPLAGDVLVGLSDKEVKGIENGHNTVTAEYAVGDQFTVSSDNYVYLIVKPQTLASGSHLIVSGTTTNYSFYRDITLNENINANSGHIIPLNIAISSILRMPTDKTGWYMVKSASWLAAEDRVVIVNHDGTQALGNVQKSNNRDGVSVAITDDGDFKKLSTTNDNMQVFIVEDGTVDNSFAFWCENGAEPSKYMYAASSTSNHLKFQDSKNGNASFVPTLSNGLGSLTAQGSNSRNVLRYNDDGSNNLFSCYSETSYKDISIYKYYGTWAGSTTCADPTITQEGNTVTIACTTPGVKIYYTTNGDDPTTESTLYKAPINLTEPVTVKVIAIRAHYTSSGVVSKVCPVKVATPVIAYSANAFTITCATEGATIHYEISTTDLASVATPTTSSASYSAAVDYAATTYVKAYAVKDGYTNSDVASATCVYSSGGGSSTTYTWTLPFSTTGKQQSDDESTTGCEIAPYTSAGVVNNVSWNNYDGKGSHCSPANHIRITVPITSSTTKVSLSGAVYGCSVSKGVLSYKARSTSLKYFTSKNTTPTDIATISSTTSGPEDMSCSITLPDSYKGVDGSFVFMLVGTGNIGLAVDAITVTVE